MPTPVCDTVNSKEQRATIHSSQCRVWNSLYIYHRELHNQKGCSSKIITQQGVLTAVTEQLQRTLPHSTRGATTCEQPVRHNASKKSILSCGQTGEILC